MRIESDPRRVASRPEGDEGEGNRELSIAATCCAGAWRTSLADENADSGIDSSTSDSSSLPSSSSPKSASVMRALRRLLAFMFAGGEIPEGKTVWLEFVDSASESGRGVRLPTRRTVRNVESLFRQSSATSFIAWASSRRSLRWGSFAASSAGAMGAISGAACFWDTAF